MSDPKVFKTTFGAYHNVSIIGEGGSGRIFLVKDKADKEYALKLLDYNKVTSRKLKRFKNELYFCLRNKHSNIVTVIDHGVTTNKNIDSPFYVMKHYKQSLRDLMENDIPKDNVLKYYTQILDGVEAAHLQNVYHRDIKPENILFDGDTDTLLVADFGIAHFEEEELFTSIETKDQERLANFQYAAPEQKTRSAIVDHRADIYALGLLLNEMYTSVIPAGTGYRTIGALYNEYSYLDIIVENMIKQDSRQRYKSIEKIKWELLSQQNQLINIQRLDKIKDEVVKDPEVNDPMISDPLRLIGFDWDKGILTLIMNRRVTEAWVQSLLNMGNYSSLVDAGPEYFRFDGTKATVGVREQDVQSVIDYFKDWLPKANRVYASRVHEAMRLEKEKKIKELQKRRKVQEARQRVLKNTRI
jgi:serine/threonine protein kinase